MSTQAAFVLCILIASITTIVIFKLNIKNLEEKHTLERSRSYHEHNSYRLRQVCTKIYEGSFSLEQIHDILHSALKEEEL